MHRQQGLPVGDALAFHDREEEIRRNVLQNFFFAHWPANLDFRHSRFTGKSKVQPRMVARWIVKRGLKSDQTAAIRLNTLVSQFDDVPGVELVF